MMESIEEKYDHLLSNSSQHSDGDIHIDFTPNWGIQNGLVSCGTKMAQNLVQQHSLRKLKTNLLCGKNGPNDSATLLLYVLSNHPKAKIRPI
jgi:hypothetical protein